MTPRIIIIGAAWVLASALGACSTPSAKLYTLAPSAGATIKADPTSSKFAVSVGPVSIPAVVDRPQIVITKGANQVGVDEFNRWASPLQSNIGQVVAADLSALLGKLSVTANVGADAEFHVAIDVQAFQSTPGDVAVLEAVWTVRRTADGLSRTGKSAISEPCQSAGYAALAAAHSRALNRLSEEIAGAIKALEAEPLPPPSPPESAPKTAH